MDYKPKSETDLAGITALQNEGYNFVFGITKHDKKYHLVLKKTEKGNTQILASKEIELDGKVQLKVEAKHDDYTFSYAENGGEFQKVGETVSGAILSTNVAGGFTGTLLGLYATHTNDVLLGQ